jgi:uncharacterized protein YbaP (TraB family)
VRGRGGKGGGFGPIGVRLAVLLLLLVPAVVSAAQVGRLPLWRVRSAEGSLHLLGSIHALPPEIYPLGAAVAKPFEEADALVLECDLRELSSAAVQEELRRRMTLDGRGLSQRLPAGLWQRLSEALRAAGLDPSSFERQKPWAAALALGELRLREAGLRMELGVDRYFFGRALERGKAVLGLESALVPVALFDSLGEAEQELLLSEALSELGVADGDPTEIVAAWTKGDLVALEAAVQGPLAKHPQLFRKLLTERNAQWLPKLEALLREKKAYFVVVGAAHLLGEHGLVEALRKKGYDAEQL